jgi:STE24 endopeptidase
MCWRELVWDCLRDHHRVSSPGINPRLETHGLERSLRQLRRLQHPAPPAHLLPVLKALPAADEFDQQYSRVFSKSQAYARAKMHFGLVSGAINCIEGLLVLVNIDKLWNLACSFLSSPSPIPCALSFVVLSSALGMITSIPASYYKTFVLEEKYGFNKTTFGTWVQDQVKTTLLSIAIGLPLTAAGLWIIEWQGPQFVQYLTGFFLAIQVLASQLS